MTPEPTDPILDNLGSPLAESGESEPMDTIRIRLGLLRDKYHLPTKPGREATSLEIIDAIAGRLAESCE